MFVNFSFQCLINELSIINQVEWKFEKKLFYELFINKNYF